LSTITVANDPSTAKHADFTTIQAAVDAASPGDDIVVYPGVYREVVLIPAGKDGIDLRSKSPLKAVIEAPATLPASQHSIVRDMGSHDVTI